MKTLRFPSFWQIFLLIGWLFFSYSCRTDQRDNSDQQYEQSDQLTGKHKAHRHHKNRQQRSGNLGQNQASSPSVSQSGDIPPKVRDVLTYVRQHGSAPDGYVGGRTFGNFENHLPKQDASGQKIRYQEWDVNPKIKGQNRGVERLITSSDGRAYYTSDHYNSFTEIK